MAMTPDYQRQMAEYWRGMYAKYGRGDGNGSMPPSQSSPTPPVSLADGDANSGYQAPQNEFQSPPMAPPSSAGAAPPPGPSTGLVALQTVGNIAGMVGGAAGAAGAAGGAAGAGAGAAGAGAGAGAGGAAAGASPATSLSSGAAPMASAAPGPATSLSSPAPGGTAPLTGVRADSTGFTSPYTTPQYNQVGIMSADPNTMANLGSGAPSTGMSGSWDKNAAMQAASLSGAAGQQMQRKPMPQAQPAPITSTSHGGKGKPPPVVPTATSVTYSPASFVSSRRR